MEGVQIMMSLMRRLHYTYAYEPRITTLLSLLSNYLSASDRVLDIGCGGGALDEALVKRMPSLHVEGIETHPRGGEAIPVHHYDGLVLPFEKDAFDVILVADVLHHTSAPVDLLKECARVATRLVIVKDHLCYGWISWLRICLLDLAANAPHGVPCLYKYWSEPQWYDMFEQAGLQVQSIKTPLKLYHWMLEPIFGGNLHFFAVARPNESNQFQQPHHEFEQPHAF
jgi:SAM-dependent methyltransferase